MPLNKPLRIGKLDLGDIPRVAVPLSDAEVVREGAKAKELADIFELRIDSFLRQDPAYVAAVCKQARGHGVPLLATIRSPNEGGKTRLSEDQRRALFETVIPLVDAIDIEFHTPHRDQVIIAAHRQQRPVIVSFHDFQRTPLDRDLLAILDVAKQHSADMVKLATTPLSAPDCDRLLNLLMTHRGKNLIIVGMGPYGAMTRVFFPLAGSLITYGFLNDANAAGQLSLTELVSELSRYSPDFARRHRQNRLAAAVGAAGAS